MNNYGSTTGLLNQDSFKTIEIPVQRKKLSWSILLSAVSVIALISVLVTLTITITINPDSTTTVEITDFVQQAAPSEEPSEATTRRSFFNFRRNRQPSVRLNQGRLRGTLLKSRGGRDYSAFYTIPYGANPVGGLRFKV